MRRGMRGLLLAAGIGVAGAAFAVSPFGLAFEEAVGLGWLFRLRGPLPPPAEVAVIAIDEASAIELGLPKAPRDWPRALHGRLVAALVGEGVDVIAFDLAFSRPKADDPAFAAAIAAAGRVLLFQTIERQRKAAAGGGELVVETIWEPVPELARAALGVGPLLLPNVPARVSRFWAFLGQSEDRASLPALALLAQAAHHDPAWQAILAAESRSGLADAARRLRQRLAAGLVAADRLPAAADAAAEPRTARLRRALAALFRGPDAYHLNFYGPPGTIRHLPYAQVIAAADAGAAGSLDLAQRVVFVGYSELTRPPDFTRDAFVTVYGGKDGVYLSGAEIAATAYANLIAGSTLRPPPPAVAGAVVLAIGLALGLAAASLPPAMAVPVTLALALAYAAAAALAFAAAGRWLPLATPILAQLPVALIAGAGGQLVAGRRRERALARAEAAALAASAAKSQALQMAGHDIRTPVQAIIGYLEQIDVSHLDVDQRRLFGRVMGASDILLDLVNGVLDLTAIEAGKLRIVDEPVDLRRLLPSLVDMLQSQAAARGLTLSLTIAADVPAAVRSDPLRLRQILANLLSNAIKFSDRGRVSLTLAAEAAAEPGSPAMLVFAVADSGIGIGAEALAQLFQPFRRVGGGDRPGTGLGLSLSRRLAQAMGGDITVDSVLGVGSTFRLLLPLRPAVAEPLPLPPPRPLPPATAALGIRSGLAEGPQAPLSAPPAPATRAAAAGEVVLVEDDEAIRALLQRQLDALGLDVAAFADGDAAWARLAAGPPPRLLITDYHLPGLDGPALIGRVRARPALAALPVIGITAAAGEAAGQAFTAAGADRVLTKPVGGADLARAVTELAPPAAAAAVFAEIAAILGPATAEADRWPAFEPAHLTDALGADHPRLAGILAAYLAQAEAQVAALAAAVASRDPEALARTAHQLAGASLSFGVIRLGERCRGLEGLAAAADWPAITTALATAGDDLAAAREAVARFLADRAACGQAPAQSSTSL